MSELLLEQDAFIRKIGLNKDVKYGFFLGAGASISSGIPSAEFCIWEWKRSIFLSNNPGLEPQFSELTLDAVRRKIQKWLDNQNRYPKLGDTNEYGFYIEKCYPTNEDRKKYFAEIIRNAKPHVGYQLLCLLAEAGLVHTVFTTNFDGLVARAANNFRLTPIEIGIDSQNRLPRQYVSGELVSISMHGDYRYDSIKNTATELQQQEKTLAEYLLKFEKDNPLIICGYSGRDKSIMNTLETACSQSGTGAIYWCGFGEEIPYQVQSLLETARKQNKAAFFTPTNGFDDLMKRLALYCLIEEKVDKARSIISHSEGASSQERTPFHIPDNLPLQTIVKSNAFEIECPADVFQFDLREWPKSEIWKWVKSACINSEIVAVPFRSKILAFGTDEEVKIVFGENLKEPIERVPIDQKELYYEDGVINALMRRALVKTIAKNSDLRTDNETQIWSKIAQKQSTEGEYKCNIFDSAILFLRRIGGRSYLIIKPSLRIENAEQGDGELPLEVINRVKIAILGYQHNKEFNQAVNRWRQNIFGQQAETKVAVKILKIGRDGALGFSFKIRRSPVFAGIRSQRQILLRPIDIKLQQHIKQYGFRLEEPALVFSTKQGKNYVLDNHPLRGLTTNRPYDYPVTHNGLLSDIKIGIICPQPESQSVQAYLHQAHSRHSPSETEKDYLIDYPGFSSAFGLPLEIPRNGDMGWIICPEPKKTNNQEASVELARILTQAISDLNASLKPSVIVIFIPNRWKNLRSFETESERFDLHDYVKAYCAQRGISSQFLEQDTITDEYQCRIWWWLSLAIYAKAMRTPWVLDALDTDTAFIGLGFSINQKVERERHVVLGCSHLYNARGEGLQFRLSPIENPTIVRGNAFMSLEDARKCWGNNSDSLF
jgi:hypothetical protein